MRAVHPYRRRRYAMRIRRSAALIQLPPGTPEPLRAMRVVVLRWREVAQHSPTGRLLARAHVATPAHLPNRAALGATLYGGDPVSHLAPGLAPGRIGVELDVEALEATGRPRVTLIDADPDEPAPLGYWGQVLAVPARD